MSENSNGNDSMEKAFLLKENTTILILGESGVGKSTFVNATINYLAYGSMQESIDKKPKMVIPTTITIRDENHQDIDTQTIESDIDPKDCLNEQNVPGQSCTQDARAYDIPLDGHTLTLIDTPGLGDVRGVEQDKINFDKVINFIKSYETITAIIILLHPNYARTLTEGLRLCLYHLFDLFGPSAKYNTFFCFTRTRGTSYAPGDTLSSLRTFVGEKGIKYDFKPSNTFCVDNESFRYSLYPQIGQLYTVEDHHDYSWNLSAKNILKIFQSIQGCVPFKVSTPYYIYTDYAKDCTDLYKAIEKKKLAQNSEIQKLYCIIMNLRKQCLFNIYHEGERNMKILFKDLEVDGDDDSKKFDDLPTEMKQFKKICDELESEGNHDELPTEVDKFKKTCKERKDATIVEMDGDSRTSLVTDVRPTPGKPKWKKRRGNRTVEERKPISKTNEAASKKKKREHNESNEDPEKNECKKFKIEGEKMILRFSIHKNIICGYTIDELREKIRHKTSKTSSRLVCLHCEKKFNCNCVLGALVKMFRKLKISAGKKEERKMWKHAIKDYNDAKVSEKKEEEAKKREEEKKLDKEKKKEEERIMMEKKKKEKSEKEKMKNEKKIHNYSTKSQNKRNRAGRHG